MSTLPDESAETLSVQVEGRGRDEPTRLLVMERPAAGRIRVREWRGDDWTAGPLEREVDVADLLDEFERAYRQRLRISEEMYRIRRWLEGIVL